VFLTSHAEREYVQRVQEITNYGYVLKSSGEFVLVESIRMAFSLFEANARSEHHAAELEARERRLDHLNRVLRSIRNINKLITRESDRDALLSKACRMLVDTSGYHRAWIVLCEKETATTPSSTPVFHAGLEDAPFDDSRFLSTGNVPECARHAMERKDVVVVEDPTHLCANCPLREDLVRAGCWSPDYATFAAPLAHGHSTYGWINVIIPADYAESEDEIELFREITGDISYALFNMSMQTAGRTARATLEESEERYRTLVETTPDGIVIIEDGRIVDCNEAAVPLFGFERKDELLGRYPWEFSPEYQPSGELSEEVGWHYLTRVLEGEPAHFEWRHVKLNGEELDVDVAMNRMTLGGRVAVQAVVRDITERKRTEERLVETLAEREELMKELNHRVKNNLAMVASLVSLKDDNLGDSADLSDINKQIMAIRTVHEKLSEASDSLDVDLQSYLEEILNATFGMLPGQRVECTVSVPAISLPAKLVTSIGLIVNELATNAVKHAFRPGQDERFRVSITELHGEGAGATGRYRMEISNSGKPFPTAVRPESSSTLGLSLVTQLVAQLQGELTIDRDPATRFTIDLYLPRQRVS
ncbi:MAG: PAS domain S-box protein, partial [Spirochaetes bacterium]|nr:PAS domain S-box protein [Spirochaetota bacterium]